MRPILVQKSSAAEACPSYHCEYLLIDDIENVGYY
jgi:hypothetical protein